MTRFYFTPRPGSTLRHGLLALVGCMALCCATRGEESNLKPELDRPDVHYADAGFVWVGKKFIAAPYRVMETDQGIEINGNLLSPLSDRDRHLYSDWDFDFRHEGVWTPSDAASPDAPAGDPMDDSAEPDVSTEEVDGQAGGDSPQRFAPFRQFRRFPRGPGFGMRHSREGSLANTIAGELSAGAAVISLPDQPLAIFSQFSNQVELFETIVSDKKNAVDPESMQGFLAGLPPRADRKVWQDWATTLVVSATARERIDEVLEAGRERERATMAKRYAIQRMDMLAYPLTVFGMILAVVSFGHLLMCLPRPYDDAPAVPSAGMMRATTYSLALVVALSAMDLVWTLMASQAGQMKELNPLASRLIQDPELLIAFKSAATAMGCGVLFKLRHHSRAQFATWWLCLVCTVLAFRWLTFNSMFMT